MSTDASWSSWASAVVTAVIAAVGACWWVLRRLLITVTREEFIAALDERHNDNRRDIHQLRNDLQTIKADVAYLRGRYERSL